mgnify:CR=1 FL=1
MYTKSMPTVLGLRVAQLREQHRWTQKHLADIVGCSINALSMIETGAIPTPRADRVIRLAAALGATTDYLLGVSDESDDQKAATYV